MSSRPLYAEPRGSNPAFRAAGVSAILGAAGIASALSPLVPGMSSSRWVISTVGLIALLWGIRAVRRGGGIGVSVLATIGIGSGAIATVVMVATYFSAQTSAHVPFPVTARPPAANVVQPSQPESVAGASSSSGALMAETVGGLVFRLKAGHAPGTDWPAELDVNADGRISPSGSDGVIGVLPVGTQLGYRATKDGRGFTIRLSDVSDPSRYVDFDSSYGSVQLSPTLSGSVSSR